MKHILSIIDELGNFYTWYIHLDNFREHMFSSRFIHMKSILKKYGGDLIVDQGSITHFEFESEENMTLFLLEWS